MHSKLTSKGRVTIPKKVREALGLKPGDHVSYEIADDNSVILRRGKHRFSSFEEAVSELLGEWDSEADIEAFLNL
jgi:AbrB family looped-hinge helix DNA binding protein